jgi:hypothetical protein
MLGLGLTFMLALSSCSDFLETEPKDRVTLEKFWNEKGDVEAIISGTYNKIAEYQVMSRMMIWGEFRSENVVDNQSTVSDLNLQRFMKENINASNGYTYWGDLYTVINRCNTIIHYAPGIAEKDPSYKESEVHAHIAEATALRSLMYFYLIRTFRNVPYSTTAYLEDSQDLVQPASSFDAVLDSCIQALESVKGWALTSYPEASGEAAYFNKGRITRDAIHALLCEMYLWKQEYQQCIAYADLLIESVKKKAKEAHYSESEFTDFNGYPLLPSKYSSSSSGSTYGFAFSSIFANGNSLESIFEINYLKTGNPNDRISNTAAGNLFGGLGHTANVTYSMYIGNDAIDGNNKVFSAADVRPYEDMNNSGHYINKYTASGSTVLIGSATAVKNMNRLYSSQYNTTNAGKTSLNKANFIVYRISDIMLLKAEALTLLMKDGQTTLDAEDASYRDQAFELVDAVNKRSLFYTTATASASSDVLKKTDYDNKTKMLNLVYEERHRELMFEGKRYFDLVRRALREGNVEYLLTNVLNKDVELKAAINGIMKDMNGIFLPYHIDELKVNTKLQQNPAFPSGESSFSSTN